MGKLEEKSDGYYVLEVENGNLKIENCFLQICWKQPKDKERKAENKWKSTYRFL